MDKGLQNFLIIFFVLAFVFVAAMMLGDSSIDIYEKKVLIVEFPFLLVPLMLFSFIISGVKSGKMLALPHGSYASFKGFCILDNSKGDSIWLDTIFNTVWVLALIPLIWTMCVSDPWVF